jgi:chromosome segregation ATPase
LVGPEEQLLRRGSENAPSQSLCPFFAQEQKLAERAESAEAVAGAAERARDAAQQDLESLSHKCEREEARLAEAAQELQRLGTAITLVRRSSSMLAQHSMTGKETEESICLVLALFSNSFKGGACLDSRFTDFQKGPAG